MRLLLSPGLMQELVEITESDLNGEDLNNAIYAVVASARRIAREK